MKKKATDKQIHQAIKDGLFSKKELKALKKYIDAGILLLSAATPAPGTPAPVAVCEDVEGEIGDTGLTCVQIANGTVPFVTSCDQFEDATINTSCCIACKHLEETPAPMAVCEDVEGEIGDTGLTCVQIANGTVPFVTSCD